MSRWFLMIFGVWEAFLITSRHLPLGACRYMTLLRIAFAGTSLLILHLAWTGQAKTWGTLKGNDFDLRKPATRWSSHGSNNGMPRNNADKRNPIGAQESFTIHLSGEAWHKITKQPVRVCTLNFPFMNLFLKTVSFCVLAWWTRLGAISQPSHHNFGFSRFSSHYQRFSRHRRLSSSSHFH